VHAPRFFMKKKVWKKFENDLKKTCLYYRKKKIALIDYNEVPTTGYGAPKTSTIDFNGAIGPYGRSIAFDAKTTHNKTSFSLSNIKTHQLEYLRFHKDVGADSYIFLQFVLLQKEDEFFKIPIEFILSYWDKEKKSIKYEDIDQRWVTNVADFLN